MSKKKKCIRIKHFRSENSIFADLMLLIDPQSQIQLCNIVVNMNASNKMSLEGIKAHKFLH